MAIKVGDRLPDGTFTRMTESGPAPVTTGELFDGRRVVLFAVPGAFTPACSRQHLPGFLKEHDALKAKGVDTIACLSTNDVFVLDAWARTLEVGDRIVMLADGNGSYVKALGLDVDLSGFGMGTRSRRFSMLVEDGVVRELNVEPAGDVTVSAAAALVCVL